MSCLRLNSRASVPSAPRKYLVVTIVRGVDRPEVGELDAALLEDRLARLPVLLDDVAPLPGHLVVRVHAGRGVDALDGQALALRLSPSPRVLRCPGTGVGLRHVVLPSLVLLSTDDGWSRDLRGRLQCRRARRVVAAAAQPSPAAPPAAAQVRSPRRARPRSASRSARSSGDGRLEVLERLERLVDAGEPQVGDLVELAQRPEDGQADLVRLDLGVRRWTGLPPRPAGRAGPGRPR